MDTKNMTDFVRDDFLEWLADECDRRGESYTICTTQDRFDRYELVWVQTSWIAWQASRQAVVVELPDVLEIGGPLGIRYFTEREVHSAIAAQGLKVAP